MSDRNTSILSPNGAPSGTLLAPGNSGGFLPHGLVLPHQLPRPEDFRLPSVAIPSATKALVPSHVTGAPPASGGPKLSLPTFTMDIGTPLLSNGPRGKAYGFYRNAKAISRRAISKVPEGIRQPLSKLGELSPRGRMDRADGQLGK